MIKMLTSMASDDFVLKPKEQTDRFSKEEERKMVESGLAEYVNAAKPNKQAKNKR